MVGGPGAPASLVVGGPGPPRSESLMHSLEGLAPDTLSRESETSANGLTDKFRIFHILSDFLGRLLVVLSCSRCSASSASVLVLVY